MKRIIVSWLAASVLTLILGLGMFYGCVYFYPRVAAEYFSAVFRNGGDKDWIFYVHPFILAMALKWFWERYKGILKGPIIVRGVEVSLVYGIVALLPILWLTYSAIDVSLKMIISWFVYGLVQSFAAGIIFARLNP